MEGRIRFLSFCDPILFLSWFRRDRSFVDHPCSGDIDPSLNMVEVTEEAKEELAKIENKIGKYICRLCKEVYGDAFGLAQHR